jgi:hypothetical protein
LSYSGLIRPPFSGDYRKLKGATVAAAAWTHTGFCSM